MVGPIEVRSRPIGGDISPRRVAVRLHAIPEAEHFHEIPDSGNECAGQGRRYRDNGHGTCSKTVSVVQYTRIGAREDARRDFSETAPRSANPVIHKLNFSRS